MIRIGIIGTESSHAMAFAKFFNLPNTEGKYSFENIRVTALWGDPDSVAAICDAVEIEFVAERPEDMLGRVDAVMITSRRGSVHFEQALPFVENGVPLFIDKPFTSDVTQATELADRIHSCGTRVMGGSNCKFAPGVQRLREQVTALREEKKLISASLGFTITDYPYDGFWFYAPHLVEIATEVFGHGPSAVSAVENGKSVIATLSYPDTAVSMHFALSMWSGSYALYTSEGTISGDLDTAGGSEAEAKCFGEMLLGAEPPQTLELLIEHVHIIDAIMCSIRSNGKQISI